MCQITDQEESLSTENFNQSILTDSDGCRLGSARCCTHATGKRCSVARLAAWCLTVWKNRSRWQTRNAIFLTPCCPFYFPCDICLSSAYCKQLIVFTLTVMTVCNTPWACFFFYRHVQQFFTSHTHSCTVELFPARTLSQNQSA